MLMLAVVNTAPISTVWYSCTKYSVLSQHSYYILGLPYRGMSCDPRTATKLPIVTHCPTTAEVFREPVDWVLVSLDGTPQARTWNGAEVVGGIIIVLNRNLTLEPNQFPTVAL